MVILGLCGSLRRDSYNHRLLAAAASLPNGLTLEVFEGLREIPPYDADGSAPGQMATLLNAIAEADALLIATSEYDASQPSHLKNALDWVSRPFPHNALQGKPVAVIGASTGLFGAAWAQADLRDVLKTIGARVVDEALAVIQADNAFASDGRLKDPRLQSALAKLIDQLTSAVNGRPTPTSAPAVPQASRARVRPRLGRVLSPWQLRS
ncbi:NADPH-dependent FMN reductase [Kribbella catacumbae]|uniref:NADPH-dependent FMN reductase n=1 Tax=Kribbella catacumbae TaxID=460086 RepID=UPI00035EFADE|nr:NADPH-dependent FMN reductase [Kribbella catacumbae]